MSNLEDKDERKNIKTAIEGCAGEYLYCPKCNELFWIESLASKDNKYSFCPKCGTNIKG